MWLRIRFYANLNDSRPIKVPALGPWWESGYNDKNSIIVAYWPKDKFEQLTEFWPEASDINIMAETNEIVYSSRFAQERTTPWI